LGLKSIKINTDLEALFEQPVDVVRLHKNIKPRFLERIKKDIVYV
jgi:predicted nucleotidyltransferase